MRTLYFCAVSSFFSSPNLSGRRWDVYHTSKFYTWCVPSANLECKSEMCCTRLAANAGRKQSLKNRHLGTNAQLCRAISSQLNTNISSRCPHNMVNFGPLAAEVVSLIWGTPGNFNGLHVLAALLHGTLVVGVSKTLRVLNRGRHLYSAVRPSGWALAHISSIAINWLCVDDSD